ncbi:unnamed protein product [Moneuplotes crassus]|uniref:Uncharacterized protein n=1 Tax=Euplotes crassus TaxID=5936 RepID=A0AAD1U5G9_EUPCR|nr:unnamed protein product [Moneuplotes crassus]
MSETLPHKACDLAFSSYRNFQKNSVKNYTSKDGCPYLGIQNSSRHQRCYSKKSVQSNYLPPKFPNCEDQVSCDELSDTSVPTDVQDKNNVPSTPRMNTPSSSLTACKTPSLSKSIKSEKCKRRQYSSRKSAVVPKCLVFDSYENFEDNIGNDIVADESDPTFGWISVSGQNITNVPHEEQSYDTFWKTKNKMYIPDHISVKQSDISSRNDKLMFQRRATSKLRDALVASSIRLKHFYSSQNGLLR